MSRESPRAGKKPVIGLAGGIGSGKSMVARILATLGAGVIDSDALSHQALGEPEVARTLTEWWGDSIRGPDGQVDRIKLGQRVFQSVGEKARLEALLHPRIARQREALIEAFQANPAVRAIVLDSPLLFEAGLHQRCDAVLFVESDASLRAERVRLTRGWPPEELARREKFQKPLDIKRTQADHIVVNNSGRDALRHQVVRFFNRLLKSLTKT